MEFGLSPRLIAHQLENHPIARVSNPGTSLVDTQRLVESPPRSRNESLASLMHRMMRY